LLILGILVEEDVQLALKLVNLSHVLVLDPKVIHLDLNVTDLSAQLVLLLFVGDDSVEHTFQVLNFIIDLLDQLVLSLLENGVFNFHINFADLLN